LNVSQILISLRRKQRMPRSESESALNEKGVLKEEGAKDNKKYDLISRQKARDETYSGSVIANQKTKNGK